MRTIPDRTSQEYQDLSASSKNRGSIPKNRNAKMEKKKKKKNKRKTKKEKKGEEKEKKQKKKDKKRRKKKGKKRKKKRCCKLNSTKKTWKRLTLNHPAEGRDQKLLKEKRLTALGY
ncbi:hypothetical protein AAES_107142 [Amazona aestiva]|uniref:Uncharacterized protein n=1 Tax=Amazona aestiva TaxID=12930 RepID=A0A0Q3URS2_AMAAE|nr:hypothetical protein AAES_107142 [Amazona aestiva]